MNYGTSTTSIYTGSDELKEKRRIVSQEESEQTEKTLHHLAGRVGELRERLGRVLIPSASVAGNNAEARLAESVSPLSERLRNFRRLAQESIDGIDDILARLDV